MGAITIAISVALLLFAIPSALAALDIVTVIEPVGGYWGGTQTIEWLITAPRNNTVDPEDHENYSIQYSTDDVTWIAIIEGLGHANTTYSWDASLIGDGTTYRINVTKTNKTDFIDNASGNSTTVFTIDNTAPTVVVASTGVGLGADDVAHTQQTTLDFSGSIKDATAGNKNLTIVTTDDGTITGNTWTVTGAALSAGCNVVTATGFDNSNNSGTDTLTVCHSPAGLAIVHLPTPIPTQPPADGLLPLSIIPEEGLPDTVKKFGVIAVIAIVLFVVWRGSGSKTKRKRRR